MTIDQTGTVTAIAPHPDDPDGAGSLDEFHLWWASRLAQGRFHVERIPFDALRDWTFDARTGNLVHSSSRYFTVEGLQVHQNGTRTWEQPIINQPEIGILGILAQDFGGVRHYLMQAKIEPGNINTMQLSPTVQATRSNYMQVHRGAPTRYLEHFVGADRAELLVDVLQSEQGAWFWHKRNRNMVALTTRDIEVHEDYYWLTMPQIKALARADNLLNMDARTVLSCLPFTPSASDSVDDDSLRSSLIRSCQRHGGDYERREDREILSWFTDAKTRCDWTARLVPLSEVHGWSRRRSEIVDDDGEQFRIIAVDVRAGTREVHMWSQPLLHPRGTGRSVLLIRCRDGVLQLLVAARPEYGLMDLVEMGPSIQMQPSTGMEQSGYPALTEALRPGAAIVHYDNELSEEGGRFYHAVTRYQILEVGADFADDLPPDYLWISVRQLAELLRHGHYLTIEARSLITCLQSLY
ncbi:NDP-hexose 2,3-dehydratase family protein [Rhodococcus qingshengii]|uniref:NDP-hexose 2,3-dehydratase family protein n=1 Tax=Rhodococcus qingshengii TaxID=334542 RepID=UPI0036D9E598